jgi:hypothetical protein
VSNEVTPLSTTPVNFPPEGTAARGRRAPYSPRWSEEVTVRFTIPAFLSTKPLCFPKNSPPTQSSVVKTHLRIVLDCSVCRSRKQLRRVVTISFREEQTLTVKRISTPSLAAIPEGTVNFTIPGLRKNRKNNPETTKAHLALLFLWIETT